MTQAPPAQALARQMRWLDQAERHRCQQVVESLTRKQREALQAFAEGLTPQEVAESMGISLSTVDSHKTPILDACRIAWAIPDDERLDYHFLRERFGPFVGDVL
jgi:CRISPR-associated protein Csx14